MKLGSIKLPSLFTLVCVLVFAIALWLTMSQPVLYKATMPDKSIMIMPPITSWYTEVRAWAVIVGQVMSGLAGLGIVVKGISGLVSWVKTLLKVISGNK